MQKDALVQAVQEWLNVTYGYVLGFDEIPQSQMGLTGWTTIYALIKGLQYELGIQNIVGNFGETTALYYDQ